MTMVVNLRTLVVIGVFGALWGALELSLGSALHALNLPFSGVFLAAAGIAVALIGHRFVPQRGAVLQIGLVAALMKAASIGGIVLMPMIGILFEALIVQGVMAVTRGQSRGSYVLAGALGCLWPLVHPFFAHGLLAGRGILTVWGWVVEDGAAFLHLSPRAAVLIIAVLGLIHAAVGALAGAVAWNTAERVAHRGGVRHASA
ncbi:hypothetical protein [Limnochorda pilosa]|uniref:Uncharacterized protein n=1 Tax=Limnochorda pilosa TaxID=1555112 RepID=A0A0K2SGU1_LIMPI|nr:hypothetical protein [Limnochorda pilosa]BAS26242.1 hypothetical protein LIP_0385 [Limnochorda pilosa]